MPRKIWADNAENFERLRQNFTTSLFIEGPNMTLPQMSERLCEMREEIERLRGALRASETALDDWLHQYAADLCNDADVVETQDRIMRHGGTLAYIAQVQERNRAALTHDTFPSSSGSERTR